MPERTRSTFPALLSVDIEPDARVLAPGDPPDSWNGFERILERMTELRGALAARTGRASHFGWFVRMDPAIALVHGTAAWAATRYSSRFSQLAAQGDEIGVHPHSARWDDERSQWITDHGDPSWIGRCVREALGSYEDVFGRRCRSFRFGDRWTSQATVAQLDRAGVRFDLTLEPEQRPAPSMLPGELATGGLPDYRGVPREAYRPSRADWRRPATWFGRRIRFFPVTTGQVLLPDGSPDVGNAHLGFHSADLPAMVGEALASLERPFLHFVVRSDVLLHADQVSHFERNLAFLAGDPIFADAVFCRPDEAERLLVRRR